MPSQLNFPSKATCKACGGEIIIERENQYLNMLIMDLCGCCVDSNRCPICEDEGTLDFEYS